MVLFRLPVSLYLPSSCDIGLVAMFSKDARVSTV